jgi:hypothetical protein
MLQPSGAMCSSVLFWSANLVAEQGYTMLKSSPSPDSEPKSCSTLPDASSSIRSNAPNVMQAEQWDCA